MVAAQTLKQYNLEVTSGCLRFQHPSGSYNFQISMLGLNCAARTQHHSLKHWSATPHFMPQPCDPIPIMPGINTVFEPRIPRLLFPISMPWVSIHDAITQRPAINNTSTRIMYNSHSALKIPTQHRIHWLQFQSCTSFSMLKNNESLQHYEVIVDSFNAFACKG